MMSHTLAAASALSAAAPVSTVPDEDTALPLQFVDDEPGSRTANRWDQTVGGERE